jgi:ribosomal protein S18 acetylase RimI-like enzyme
MMGTAFGARVELRPAEATDDGAMRELFGSTRGAEFAALPPAMLDELLELQYNAQSRHFAAAFPHSVHEMIEIEAVPLGRTIAGRMITSASTDGIRLVDIAITTAHQGRGVGTRVLSALCARADAEGQRIDLSVWAENGGARRLYERLGFDTGEETGGYLAMSRTPAGTTSWRTTADV